MPAAEAVQCNYIQCGILNKTWKQIMNNSIKILWNQNNRKNGEIGKHELNEMGALTMKLNKWNKLDKSERSSYSPVVFKHGCLLES